MALFRVLNLMNGPFSHSEAYEWPFLRLGAIHKLQNAKNVTLKLMDGPFLCSEPYEWPFLRSEAYEWHF